MLASQQVDSDNNFTDYLIMETSELKKLSKSQLYDIIFRFNNELSYLEKSLNSASEDLQSKSIELEELKEQFNFVKETNQLLSSELSSSYNSLTDCKKKLGLALNELRKSTDVERNSRLFDLAQTSLEENFNNNIISARSRITDIEKENKSLRKTLEDMKAEKESLEFQFGVFRDSEMKKNQALSEALQSSKGKEQKKKEKIWQLEEQISHLQLDLLRSNKRYQTEISNLKEESAEALAELQAKIENFKHNISSLKSRLACTKLKKITAVQNNCPKDSDSIVSQYNDSFFSDESFNDGTGDKDNENKDMFDHNDLVIIIQQLENIYKEYTGDISRTTKNDESFYLLKSHLFSSIENQLNELISTLYEAFEHSVVNETPAESSPFRRYYTRVYPCTLTSNSLVERSSSLKLRNFS